MNASRIFRLRLIDIGRFAQTCRETGICSSDLNLKTSKLKQPVPVFE